MIKFLVIAAAVGVLGVAAGLGATHIGGDAVRAADETGPDDALGPDDGGNGP